MTVRMLDPFSEVVDERRRWTPPWYSWLSDAMLQVQPGVWSNTVAPITGAYTLSNNDAGKTISLGGNAFYTLTIGAPSTFVDTFLCVIVNSDNYPGGRAKTIAISGRGNVLLWPGQGFMLYRIGSGANDWQAIPSDPVPLRWMIPGPVTLNVNTTLGNDSNDGLATGAGNALLTVARALSIIADLFDTNHETVTISVVGNVSQAVSLVGPWVGSGVVNLVGNTTTPASCTWTVTAAGASNIVVNAQARLRVSGFRFVNSGGGGTCLAAGTGGTIEVIGKVEFGACATGNHMAASSGGRIICNSVPYTILGSAATHAACYAGGVLLNQVCTVTITGTPAFSQFAFASGSATMNGNTYSGAVSAGTVKFRVALGGQLLVNGAGVNYLPGGVAGVGGTTAGGGFYG
jgi:hypothetical protein